MNLSDLVLILVQRLIEDEIQLANETNNQDKENEDYYILV